MDPYYKKLFIQRASVSIMSGLLADPTEMAHLRNEDETCEEATARRAVEHAIALASELGKLQGIHKE